MSKPSRAPKPTSYRWSMLRKFVAESLSEREDLEQARGVVVVADLQAGDVFLNLPVDHLQAEQVSTVNL
jgi:hypothetical protein